MKPEIHAIVTAVNELTRQMAVDADRNEKLEAALRTVKEWHGYGLPPETTRIIDAALEGKDD
jgi:hypothetical protein